MFVLVNIAQARGKPANVHPAAVGVIQTAPGCVRVIASVRSVIDVVDLLVGLALAVVNIANTLKEVAVFQTGLELVNRVPTTAQNNMIRCVVVMVELTVMLAWQHLPGSLSVIKELA